MVGSAGFALASLPFAADAVGPRPVAVTYFVASIFFTSAAFEQLRACRLVTLEWWSSLIQLLGTLFFNISTFAGMAQDLSGPQVDLLVWSPDVFGSACFLISSALAVREARGHRIAERVSWENLIGSIAFGISAIAAYVIPNTSEALNASLASSFTLIGALLFFRAAQLLPRATPT
jgi:YrhK-like protein